MNPSANQKSLPRPFLKWVGGKGQLLPALLSIADMAVPFRRYHEPFIGGGALFFELYRTERLPRTSSCLSDNNERLIETYQGVKDYLEEVIYLLKNLQSKHSYENYYKVRAEVPDSVAERSARIIYLNRTCYNGLFRENSRGQFNVPMGRYVNPTICDEINLRAVSGALQKCRLNAQPFERVLDDAASGDLVYFDPPYVPISNTSSFTSYNKQGFGEEDQIRLADTFTMLSRKGVKVVLSNSDTPFVRRLYRSFRINTVKATRRVNSRADRRGEIDEVVVTNFP